MNHQHMDIPQRKLFEARERLNELTKLITEKSAELRRLRTEKKEAEDLISALDDQLNKSFVEKQSFPWAPRVRELLDNVFRIKSFRGHQETVINCTLSGKDCIYVAATGSGKSLVFQLPALISSGITLVVSPLLSLMEDQVFQLTELGIPAIVMNSTTTREEAKRATMAMVDQNADLKLIYVTPEKLAKSKYFMSQIQKMYEAGRFSRLVIDEVHCCSEWGHDFRKDYKLLHIFKREFSQTPILGLTATATPTVIKDIQKILGIPKCLVYKGSFYRPNLYYEIRATSSKDCVMDILDLINTRFHNQSGIIYCLTIKETIDVASKLCSFGVPCQAYHAQLENKSRSIIQQQWYNNQCRVIAATVAFGLGINKMDVRFVIHYTISKSLENYYQETGRAGRDGNPAYCICYYRFSDVFRATSLTFGEQKGQERVYKMLMFCLNRQDCRKKLIAEHFVDGLVKDKTDKECCDNCRYVGGQSSRAEDFVDASDWLDTLIEILTHAQRINEKLTPNKLIDAWMQVKGPKKLRLEGITRPSLSRVDCETIVGSLICQGYLEESFTQTPYSVISYIDPRYDVCNAYKAGNYAVPKIHRNSLESLAVFRDPLNSPQHFHKTVSNGAPTSSSKPASSRPKKEPEMIDIRGDEINNSWDEVECFTID